MAPNIIAIPISQIIVASKAVKQLSPAGQNTAIESFD
jgi:hypothetical protein